MFCSPQKFYFKVCSEFQKSLWFSSRFCYLTKTLSFYLKISLHKLKGIGMIIKYFLLKNLNLQTYTQRVKTEVWVDIFNICFKLVNSKHSSVKPTEPFLSFILFNQNSYALNNSPSMPNEHQDSSLPPQKLVSTWICQRLVSNFPFCISFDCTFHNRALSSQTEAKNRQGSWVWNIAKLLDETRWK